MPNPTPTFGDLVVGQVVTIPYARPHWSEPDPVEVEVLTAPEPCPLCPALLVRVRYLDTRQELVMHRLPGREVIPVRRSA